METDVPQNMKESIVELMELLEKEREERNRRMQRKVGNGLKSWELGRSSRVAGDVEPVAKVIVAVIPGGERLTWIEGAALDSGEGWGRSFVDDKQVAKCFAFIVIALLFGFACDPPPPRGLSGKASSSSFLFISFPSRGVAPTFVGPISRPIHIS
ncbi:hypothetical protein PanWU01x14_114240 [Parasponia andersonii]|uniref:Uncharacterized protein n=1 Tax=Parasponia andersonii TaxID=3476 RepID=A0A2P5CXC9_PARAD|nr:hypothetical protein PanWU01x14_114240 [Parasponia andersonii]